jgi:hypothetical protein
MTRYRYVVADAVLITLIQQSKREGDRLLRAFAWLAENPSDTGDFVQRTLNQRPIYIRRFGKWLVHFGTITAIARCVLLKSSVSASETMTTTR